MRSGSRCKVLSGSGAAGQTTGVLNLAGTTTLTYTDASPTLATT